MRWIWRAERGASALEYAGLVVLAAALVTALVAYGLPGTIQTKVSEAVCVIMGDDGCKVEAGGPSEEGGDDPSSEPSPSPNANSSNTDGDGGEGSTEGENVAYDPELAADYEDAKEEQKKANEQAGSIWDDILDLLLEFVGYKDIERCVTKGDIGSCVWALVGLVPWGKVGKLISKIPKAIKLFKKFVKGKKAKNAAKTKVDDALEACKKGKKKNSFAAGTPVLLANGRYADIEDVERGDEVLATDPATGRTSAQPVTDTITGSGTKDLVTVTVLDATGAGPLTATDEHPFWVPDESAWVDAADLTPGDTLRTPNGDTATVASLTRTTQRQTVHNLSVDGVHTYYVSVGDTSLLTHNEDPVEGTACDAGGAPDFNWSPKSVKTWGHTFSRHGAGKQNTKKLQGRAASTGKDQGQWKNDDEAAEFLKGKYNSKSDGPQEIELPKGMGQVVKPNGEIVEATHVRVVMKSDGTFRTAIPIVK